MTDTVKDALGDRPPVSVVLPVKMKHGWQLSMTRHAIETLRCTTDYPFQLVVVETGTEYLKDACDLWVYVPEKDSLSPNYDSNLGLAAADGEFIVYTGNDVFVRPGWLEALLVCFGIPDCGLATLASADLKHTPPAVFFGQPIITEGVYGPFMMMRKGEEFDWRRFPSSMGDSDLIMRVYRRGQRMYRNNSVIIEHLNQQTLGHEASNRALEDARRTFVATHSSSPLLFMYRILTEGLIV